MQRHLQHANVASQLHTIAKQHPRHTVFARVQPTESTFNITYHHFQKTTPGDHMKIIVPLLVADIAGNAAAADVNIWGITLHPDRQETKDHAANGLVAYVPQALSNSAISTLAASSQWVNTPGFRAQGTAMLLATTTQECA